MISRNEFLAEFEIKGWLVEWRHEVIWKSNSGRETHTRFTQWERHWNNKIYETKEIAEAAMSNQGVWQLTQFRYRPLYAKKLTGYEVDKQVKH